MLTPVSAAVTLAAFSASVAMFRAQNTAASATVVHLLRISVFDGIDISEQDKADIVGANAGRLFRVPRPEFQRAT